MGVFVKKSKNRSKNRVFDFFGLKMDFFLISVHFQSAATYEKLIAPKTKKLERNFWKMGYPPPALDSVILGEGGVSDLKNPNNFFFSDPFQNSSGEIFALGTFMISPVGFEVEGLFMEVIAIFRFFKTATHLLQIPV